MGNDKILGKLPHLHMSLSPLITEKGIMVCFALLGYKVG